MQGHRNMGSESIAESWVLTSLIWFPSYAGRWGKHTVTDECFKSQQWICHFIGLPGTIRAFPCNGFVPTCDPLLGRIRQESSLLQWPRWWADESRADKSAPSNTKRAYQQIMELHPAVQHLHRAKEKSVGVSVLSIVRHLIVHGRGSREDSRLAGVVWLTGSLYIWNGMLIWGRGRGRGREGCEVTCGKACRCSLHQIGVM